MDRLIFVIQNLDFHKNTDKELFNSELHHYKKHTL